MKKRLRILSLLLALIFILSTLISCGTVKVNDSSDNGNGDKNNVSPQDNSDTIDANVLTILKNLAYTAKVIIPDSATIAETAVYAKLRNELKNLTSVGTTFTTDTLPEGATRDENECAILIGNTNYDESKQVYEKSNYGNYSLSVVNNKIVLAFITKEEGLELLELLLKSIKNNENGEFWVERKLSISKKGLLQLEGIPRFPGETTLVDCNDSTSMIVASRTNLETFKQYCTTLEQNGFSLYSSRDNVNGNYFYTYTKDSLALTVYFTPSTKATRIIAGPLSDIPTKEKDTTPETYTPSLTIVSQNTRLNNGLGLVYLLPNGKFLIIDGGYSMRGTLYNLLRELAPDEDEIVIAAWYISHPHGDHQQALITLLKDHSKDVKIESILFNYTTADQYDAVTTGSDGASSMKSLNSALTKYLSKDTKIIKPHTGQIYEYGSAKVEIIYTVEDVLPKTLDYLNTSSLVVRVTIGDHSMLALADTTHISGNILEDMFGATLQSDMVQLAHHGTHPGYASLYNTVKAKVLIWPSNYVNAKAQIENSAVAAAVNQATDVYIANVGDHLTLKLPYEYTNNKQDFLNEIGKS